MSAQNIPILAPLFRVLLRVCQTLKSRARDVRDTARDTLVNIAASLGPEYFPFVLKEMKSVLQRGYQVVLMMIWYLVYIVCPPFYLFAKFSFVICVIC